MTKQVTIIGAGPAGLFSAYLLLKNGYEVHLYDHSSGPAKKFLIAGNGGLNLTHSEDLSIFATRYAKDELLFKELLSEFSPTDLRQWCHSIGIETFVGSSGRVFPTKLKAGEIVINWLKQLKSYEKFKIFLNHDLINISADKKLVFLENDIEKTVKATTIILALGGASWKKTGSDGKWKSYIEALDVKTNPFLPMNCGFERKWSEYFIKHVDRTPVKNIALTIDKSSVRSELMLTPFGIEGSAVYALSSIIRDKILEKGKALVSIDLKPDLSLEEIKKKLSGAKKKDSLANILRKTLGLNKEILILIKELHPNASVEEYPSLIKKLEIKLEGIRPIDEAISTSGGVCFSGLTNSFESTNISGLYFAGEMLDFEAPTGGYLLQACFCTANRVIAGILSNDKSSLS